MTSKTVFKMTIDCCLTILLLLMVAFELVGRQSHEWIGMGMFLLVLMGLILGVLLFFTLREYRPKPIETTDTPSGEKTLSVEDSLRILTCNTGYGSLDASEDFFMDGGSRVQPDKPEAGREKSAWYWKVSLCF